MHGLVFHWFHIIFLQNENQKLRENMPGLVQDEWVEGKAVFVKGNWEHETCFIHPGQLRHQNAFRKNNPSHPFCLFLERHGGAVVGNKNVWVELSLSLKKVSVKFDCSACVCSLITVGLVLPGDKIDLENSALKKLNFHSSAVKLTI